MDTNSYLTWGPDPRIFTSPEIQLPFSLSFPGLLLAAVIFYFGWQKIKPKKEGEKMDEPWKAYALAAVAFIVGQIPFFFIEMWSIDTIPSLQPRWYGLLFAMAFIIGYTITFRMYRDAGRTQEEMDRLLIYMLVATIIGARLGHVFFYNADYYLQNLHLIPQIWTGGLASHGAAIGILIGIYLYVKKTPRMSFLWVADRVVPATAVGAILIRIGNFMNSEILGRPTDLPWAVVFERAPSLTAAEQAIPRHPSMLYESVFGIITLAVLLYLYRRFKNNPPEGSLFATFLIMIFTGRFLIEFTKLPHSDFEMIIPLNMGQWLSIPLVAYGIWLLVKKVDWSGGSPES